MIFSKINSRLRKSGFVNPITLALMIALGVVILAAGPNSSSLAGQKQPELELGVTYSCPQNNNYEFKVLSCDNQDWCQVFIANKFSPNGGSVTGQGKATTVSLIQKWSCSVKGRPVQ